MIEKKLQSLFALLVIAPMISNGQSADSRLRPLYESGRWSDLSEAIRAQFPGERAPALYRGVVSAVFNEDRAERVLRQAIASDPHSEDAYQAYEWLAHIYFRTGRYRQFVTDMETRWAAFPNKSEVRNEQAAIAGFRGLPDQATVRTGHATLPHQPGEIFIPVAVNGGPATFFFDTGAWVNCISEDQARRLGLAIRDGDGTLGTGTGVRTGFRTAVAGEVAVGGSRFQNVTFAVFPDDQEPWKDLPIGRRGLIGIPVILGLRTLRWAPGGALEIGMRAGAVDHRKSNLFFDEDHLVAAARVGERRILGTLDTGAETTDLYEGFAKEFGDLLAQVGKKDATEVRGVGHAETFESVTLPELKLNIGGMDAVLRPAHVLLKPLGAKRTVGNFGLDLLRQGRAFRIDFGAMRLSLD